MARFHWQVLSLPSEPPRSETMLTGLDLMPGLISWRVMGTLAWVGAGIILLSLAVPAPTLGLQGLKFLAALMIAGIAYGFSLVIRRQLTLRREALLSGLPVAGSVVRHGKRLNPFSSSPHRTVTALLWLPEGQQSATGVICRREALRDLPLGAQLIGLWLPDSGRIWLPLEIGLRIEAEPLEPKEHVLSEESQ